MGYPGGFGLCSMINVHDAESTVCRFGIKGVVGIRYIDLTGRQATV